MPEGLRGFVPCPSQLAQTHHMQGFPVYAQSARKRSIETLRAISHVPKHNLIRALYQVPYKSIFWRPGTIFHESFLHKLVLQFKKFSQVWNLYKITHLFQWSCLTLLFSSCSLPLQRLGAALSIFLFPIFKTIWPVGLSPHPFSAAW